MTDRCRWALGAAAERCGIEATTLSSGGGHDTMKLAAATDVGMLFAPSQKGISHSPAK